MLSIRPMLIQQYCLGVSDYKYMFRPGRLNIGCVSSFGASHSQTFLLKCFAHLENE